MCSSHINFNPRTHVGCDIVKKFRKSEGNHFNPRTHVGCDPEVYRGAPPQRISIHAPTWGATYPRVLICGQVCISIHAPTWGATTFALSTKKDGTISIHAPTWGATRSYMVDQGGCKISIHAPTWGATVKPSNGWLLGHKDNEFANENIIIINSVNIT